MEEALLSLATYGYQGLFAASFLAATVLPFSSGFGNQHTREPLPPF